MYREYNKYDNIKQAGKSEKENQSMKKVDTYHVGQYLFRDVAHLIDETRKSVAYTVNSALTYMYWRIGKRVNDEILQHERAEYGSQIVASLSQQLQNAYGKGFEEKYLRRMMQFSSAFQDETIVVSVIRQLSWIHFSHSKCKYLWI